MKIAVLIKEVPDTYGERHLDLETGLMEREGTDLVLDEVCERAVELALTYVDEHPESEVVAISMAPVSAAGTIRKALAMGANQALHVSDDALVGADLGLTAEVLSAAVRRVQPDLVIVGNQSTDGTGGLIATMLAEHLDAAAATNLVSVEITDTEVRGVRVNEHATMEVAAEYPAIISITEAFPDGRFPTFKGMTAAKKKPIETIGLADLGIDAEDHSTARSIMLSVAKRPPREPGEKIVDSGDAGSRLAQYLAEQRLA